MFKMFLFWLSFVCLMPNFYAGSLKIDFFPQEIYRGTLGTFVLRVEKAPPVVVLFDGKEIVRNEQQQTRREFNLKFEKSGRLTFKQGDESQSFQVVTPEDDIQLSGAGAFLYHKKLPVILMPRHLHPPKHNREGEALALLKSVFIETRTKISNPAMLGAAFLDGDLKTKVAALAGNKTADWRVYSAAGGLLELNSLLTQSHNIKDHDALILALSASDLRRGLSFLSFRQRLEFLLQRLKNQNDGAIFVPSLSWNAMEKAQFSKITKHIDLAVRGNGADFLQIPYEKHKARDDPEKWFAPVKKKIEKGYRFE